MAGATRESTAVRWVSGALAFWSIFFALDTMRIGALVTSKQWQYLMSVPGGRFSWAALYLSGGIIIVYGLVRKRYRVMSGGLFLMAVGMISTALFYFFAPYLNADFLTLGYWIWLLGAGICTFVAAVNWSEETW